jgi:hypothetical protein
MAQQFKFVASVNGVRAMFLNYSGARSIAALNREFHPERVKEEIAVETPTVPMFDLTTMQTIALLRMRCSTLCRGIATHLQNEVQDTPSAFDYRGLVAYGLCYKPDGERWHQITAAGIVCADKIAIAKAQELRIHIMREGGNHGPIASYTCTCGRWTGSFQRGAHTERNAYANWLRHVAKESPTKEAESA